MISFSDYKAAFSHAQERANHTGRDYGIRKQKEYGQQVFLVTLLPSEDKAFGFELWAERVKPERGKNP